MIRCPVHLELLALAVIPFLCAWGAREKVIFDTDIGGDVDDALALAYLLRDENCELMGVTIEAWGGNGPRQAEIASAVCRDFGRDVHIAIGPGAGNVLGERAPRDAPKPPRYWPVVEGRDYRRFAPRNDAIGFLRRTIRANPHEVTVLATGHFTNLAALFAVDPELPALIKRLVVMGGNLSGRGEWNAAYDPVATAVVFANGNHARPAETLIVGSDVTSPYHLPPDEARRFLAGIPSLALCAEAAEYWFKDGFELFFHDPIAAVAALHPDVAGWTNATVSVSFPKGLTTFDAKADPRHGPLKVATQVDYASFRRVFETTMRTPALSVTFTFDDALKCHVTETAPLLESQGFTGVFCIPTDWVGRTGKLSWDDVRELKRRGHEVVPHGAAHTNLVEMLRRGETDGVRDDLRRAREAFRRELGETPAWFALPYNACDARLAEMLRAEGFEPLTTLRPSASVAVLDKAVRLRWRHLDLLAHGESVEDVVRAAAARRSHVKVVRYAAAHPAGTRCSSPMRGVLCLTFDDGHFGDWRAAMPVFDRFGAKATFYASGALGDAQTDEIRRLRAAGQTVGVHTVRHANAPESEDRAEVKKWADREVDSQVARLKEEGLPVHTLAYPNNRHTAAADAYLTRTYGFTHFRAGAKGIRYGFKGDVTPETVQRFDTVDTAFKPVEWCFWKPNMDGIGLGPVYCYSRENVFRALRRAAERNEIVTFFSHRISADEPDWVSMKTAWLEEILAEADRLGLRILGIDDLGRQ